MGVGYLKNCMGKWNEGGGMFNRLFDWPYFGYVVYEGLGSEVCGVSWGCLHGNSLGLSCVGDWKGRWD